MTALFRAFYGNAYLLLIVTTLFWGGNAVAARASVGHISPMVLTAGRWVFVVGIAVLFLRKEIAEAWPVLRTRWRFTLLMGTFGFTIFNTLMYIAGHYTSAIHITLLQGSIPIFTILGALIAYRTPIRGFQILGMGIAFAGVAITASGGDLGRLASLAFNFGDVLMVCACALYAAYTVGLKVRPAISGLAFFSGMAIAALFVSLPILGVELAMGKSQWPTPRGWLIVLYVAFGPSFLAQMFYMRSVELIGPSRTGLFANLVPVMGAILAVLILNEPFGWHHAIAIPLVLGGIAIAEQGRK